MSQSAEEQTSILLLLNGGQELNALDVFGFNSLHPSDHIDYIMLPIKQAVHILVTSSSHAGPPWNEGLAVNPQITDARFGFPSWGLDRNVMGFDRKQSLVLQKVPFLTHFQYIPSIYLKPLGILP